MNSIQKNINSLCCGYYYHSGDWKIVYKTDRKLRCCVDRDNATFPDALSNAREGMQFYLH